MIRFVVAYRAEAAVLINHFRLQRQPQQAFPLYCADGTALVISGSGKINAAAATAYLHGASGFHRDAAWINIGIAGHAVDPPGSAHLASKIVDVATGRVLHLSTPATAPWSTAALYTHDRPHRGGRGEQWMYDMEASGFATTARRFSGPQLVHCLKIISDNRDTAIEVPTAGRLESWMAPQMQRLENFIGLLQQQA